MEALAITSANPPYSPAAIIYTVSLIHPTIYLSTFQGELSVVGNDQPIPQAMP